jgi:hypothetical protein
MLAGWPKTEISRTSEDIWPGSIHHSGMDHISDHDLERFHLGMVQDEAESATIEVLTCSDCIDAAEEAAQYVDAIRVGVIRGDVDL